MVVNTNMIISKDNAKHVALVVSCTKRKHGQVQSQMFFHTLGPMQVNLLADEWLQRMKQTEGHCVAENLYCGAGWKHACRARSAVEKKLGTANLYILSAGFGLLRAKDLVPPYMATFSPDQNQVARQVEGSISVTEAHRKWWQSIMAARKQELPSALAELHTYDYVVAAASADYLEAAQDDLYNLALIYGRKQLFIISIAASQRDIDPAIKSCLLPIDICIERMLPGPRFTVNERALVWILDRVIPKVSWNREAIDVEISKKLAPYQIAKATLPKRRLIKMSDTEIKMWIRLKFEQLPNTSKYSLLRDFRSSKGSCEQGRFSRLVDAVKVEGTLY